jgi:putative PIN family toxin of toxin-antitoxin system
MPPKTKVVPDSNVYIAAALNRSYSYDWLFGASEPQATYELYTSEAILTEVGEKLAKKFHFDRAAIANFLTDLDQLLHKVRPTIEINAVRDPKDDMILECAIEAGAALIITFDKDLLSLKNFRDIQIAHPGMVKYWFYEQRLTINCLQLSPKIAR